MTVCQTILALTALSAACPAWSQQACERLASLPIHGVTIISAASVPAGSFTLPGNAPATTVQMPGILPSDGDREQGSPHGVVDAAAWNHKLLGVGNGGFAGSISYVPMVKPLQQGYATSSTDTGHQGSGPTPNGHWDTTNAS
jgi:feruloyl esterase